MQDIKGKQCECDTRKDLQRDTLMTRQSALLVIRFALARIAQIFAERASYFGALDISLLAVAGRQQTFLSIVDVYWLSRIVVCLLHMNWAGANVFPVHLFPRSEKALWVGKGDKSIPLGLLIPFFAHHTRLVEGWVFLERFDKHLVSHIVSQVVHEEPLVSCERVVTPIVEQGSDGLPGSQANKV